jgi:ABC-type phosphate/phosphonate transport system permease subunit
MTNNTENKDPYKDDKPAEKIEIKEKKEPEAEKPPGLFNFARTNTKDAIAYIILIIGVILLFFERFSGELLIGIVFGLYYSGEIQSLFRHFNEFIEEQGIVRGIVLGVTVIALFISAPGVFIGAILAVIIKFLFSPDKS